MQTKKTLLNLLVKYIYILPGCLQHCCFSFALAPWSIVCQIMRYKDRRQTRVWRTTELQPQRPRLHSNLPYEPSSAGQRMTHIRRTPPGLSVVIQDYLIHSVAHLQTPPLSPDKVEQNKILEERVGKERKGKKGSSWLSRKLLKGVCDYSVVQHCGSCSCFVSCWIPYSSFISLRKCCISG